METRQPAASVTAPQPSSSTTLTITTEQFPSLGKELAIGVVATVASSLGATVDVAALINMVEILVERYISRMRLSHTTAPPEAAAPIREQASVGKASHAGPVI